MVTTTELRDLLVTERVMPIIRSTSRENAVAIGRTLIDAGFRALEVSLTTPGALDAIGELAADARAEIGAGTVLTAKDVAAALAAGATFMVTPAVTASIEASADAGVPVLAGALTPTEILAALERGATAVKLFPAEFGGPAYLSALRAPFPDVPLIPVGGVDLTTGRDYLQRGALALGVGSPLTGKATDPVDLISLALRAAAFRTLSAQE
ncbi:bifunctional 4-hydroxy-2-oxoglutarate aldolase/2-dehydro-3-deoxy-phosphogluconate aldolase [Microbacterium allomyrinae]|jgi:2-dehydro-3-deoxyphosphogluconate aldolase/(4S)-4-hydroxy-2-oxoglutarate aldolase|uniref:Bifunctional 4-hydroxy-2-oxoglutarate aldolase/2-dehydro-3-deoxy-phosphogluconate aldolase n=1 Tax=Microbacterium allomyrinae TaxID=2830666 RepID=A0A9X1LV84_9MICO|nr:bifunctional 4-hydroxy-2-oxoglutarate aldolase/2-dehydro-3-deoxy-phosphogluconate aldolase [Microbacterium allomyrinae]MCC2032650.1 bifunctional 4-hydroxy-2-oxoglutarate aldolase/2-dehydro-3-deoxy-phosphogluconate aldolase [Microbacterium allomyrinae]